MPECRLPGVRVAYASLMTRGCQELCWNGDDYASYRDDFDTNIWKIRLGRAQCGPTLCADGRAG